MIRPGWTQKFYIKFVGGLSADLDFFNLLLGCARHEQAASDQRAGICGKILIRG
jgi:hypothetical protein